MGETYVDVEGMGATLSDMLGTISALEGHIDAYDTDASTSLGESSFKPAVESQLEGLKSGYMEIIPELNAMKAKIEEIMNEYNLRASKVENAGGASADTQTGVGSNTRNIRTVA